MTLYMLLNFEGKKILILKYTLLIPLFLNSFDAWSKRRGVFLDYNWHDTSH